MAEKKFGQDQESAEVIIAKAKDFWEKYGRLLTIASIVVIVIAGGWYVYQEYFKKPKEAKAVEMMFRAEEYYRTDSIKKALNGDGQYWGFLKVIDQYGGTKAGNLARYYVGSCYIKLNDNEKALQYLKKFETSSKPVQAMAYKLMADAYADLGKSKDALDYYKKAAEHFDKDVNNAAECLFLAAYLAQRTMNDSKTAIELYKELKEKYPNTQQGSNADNYLAQLGIYNTGN